MVSKLFKSLGVVIITHHAKKHLPHCLPAYINSPLKPRILLVNSSSQDGTVEMAKQFGVETLIIPRAEFNHGTTREKARKLLDTEIVVMVTPDAYPIDHSMLEKLIAPIAKGEASISYGRQLPHLGAGFFEAFPRSFNYPETSHIRSIQDAPQHGIYTIFCSNSCAAYLNRALDEVGGFSSVLTGEDTLVTARLLRRGHRIAYVAEACVRHSHRYSLLQEFRRNFDTGLARKMYGQEISIGEQDEKRGKAFVKAMARQLLKRKPYLLPYAFLQTLAKWLGYRLGKASSNAPLCLKKLASSQDFYWKYQASDKQN